MDKRSGTPIVAVSLALLLAMWACSQASTPVPTATHIAATATRRPTPTPLPTATADAVATEQAQSDEAMLQKYVERGYLTSTAGRTMEALPATFALAQINYLNLQDAGVFDRVKDFAFWGDVKWESAGPVNYPEFSGCGIAFRLDDKYADSYYALVTNDSVVVAWCFAALGNRCGRVGTTRGKGTLRFGNPAEAHLGFVVRDGHAYAEVDDEFVGEYSLFEDRLTEPGFFTYSISSGTNKDYGTRCSIDNARLWIPEG